MTEEEKLEIRTMMVEVTAASGAAVEKSIRDQLSELYADVALCLDRFDALEVDVREVKKELERLVDKTVGLVVDMRETKVHMAKMSREHIKDRAAAVRLISMEARLVRLESEKD